MASPTFLAGGSTPNPKDTTWFIEQRILGALVDGGGGGGGGSTGQVMRYTAGSNPNADGLVPTDPSQPATAYSADGSGSVYGWTGATWV